MNCRDFSDHVDAWIDGLLPSADASAAKDHATACASCAADADRARRFRDMLAAAGREAVSRAADRDAAERARAAAAEAAPLPFLRRHAVPFAAAAALVAGLAVGFAAAGRPSSPSVVAALDASAGEIRLARGERRQTAEGRTVVADEGTVVAVVEGSNGERVRMTSGAAAFQVERGRPFSVVTPRGEAEVRGTHFYVAVRDDGSVGVSVQSGVVVFRPAGGAAPSTLREGAVLDVTADGTQRMTTRGALADLEVRAEMQGIEIETLQGEIAKKDETIAALRAQIPGDGGAPDDEARRWYELGAAWRRMLTGRFGEPDFVRAFAEFQKMDRELRALTGETEPWEWPLHPAVVERTARGFVDALAPTASDAARTAAADAMIAASHTAAVSDAGVMPAEAASARLRMLRGVLTGLRDALGADVAAELARSFQSAREGAGIRPFTDDEMTRAGAVGYWQGRLSLDEAQTARVHELLAEWIVAAKQVQSSIVASWGEEAGQAFLASGVRGGRRRAEPPTDPAEAIELSLRRIDAKLDLLVPRAAYERALLAILTPEQAKKMTSLREDPFVPVWR